MKHTRRRLRQSVAGANISEGSSWVGVAGKVPEIDDVGSPRTGGCQGSHSERVDGDGWVDDEPAGVAADKLLDGCRCRNRFVFPRDWAGL